MVEAVKVDGVRGVLVMCGLGTPFPRAFCAAALVGVLAYAFKLPRASFTEEGDMRPLKPLSNDPEATYAHFLSVPLSVGLAVNFLV
jgi:hypothetical protein